MKKITILFALALLATGFSACTPPATSSDVSSTISSIASSENSAVESSSVVESDSPASTSEEASSRLPGGPITLTEPLMVADAAKYRGTVTEIREEDGLPVWAIEQAEGTVFGPVVIDVYILEGTRTNFEQSDLVVGDYIEVYFGAWNISEGTESVDAIAINHLGSAAMRLYNGEVESIQVSEDDPNTGSIMMRSFAGDNQMVFHFNKGGQTNFYLDFNSIKPGTKLNIFHEMAVASSLPPQTFAIEVRPFEAPEE